MNDVIEKLNRWEEESRKRCEAADELISSGNAWDFIQNPEALKILFNDDLHISPLWVDIGGIGTFEKDTIPALHLQVRSSPDGECGKEVVIFETDPIEDLINGWGDPSQDESSRAAFDRAYAALQGGIDRLRAYEAECLKSQS